MLHPELSPPYLAMRPAAPLLRIIMAAMVVRGCKEGEAKGWREVKAIIDAMLAGRRGENVRQHESCVLECCARFKMLGL